MARKTNAGNAMKENLGFVDVKAFANPDNNGGVQAVVRVGVNKVATNPTNSPNAKFIGGTKVQLKAEEYTDVADEGEMTIYEKKVFAVQTPYDNGTVATEQRNMPSTGVNSGSPANSDPMIVEKFREHDGRIGQHNVAIIVGSIIVGALALLGILLATKVI